MKPTCPVEFVWVPPHASTSQSAMLTILRVLEGTTPPWKSLNPYFASASLRGSVGDVDGVVLHDHVVRRRPRSSCTSSSVSLRKVSDVEPPIVLLLERRVLPHPRAEHVPRRAVEQVRRGVYAPDLLPPRRSRPCRRPSTPIGRRAAVELVDDDARRTSRRPRPSSRRGSRGRAPVRLPWDRTPSGLARRTRRGMS